MNAKSKGFSLLELVAVILVLGVVASVAIPRFVDLSTAARQSSAQALSGALGSGSAINYAADIIARSDLNSPSPLPVLSCDDAVMLLESSTSIEGYRIDSAPGEPLVVSGGQKARCLVVHEDDSNIQAEFILYGVGPI